MPNPWNVPQPDNVPYDAWVIAEQFANDNFADVEGTWIDAWVQHDAGGIPFNFLIHGQWNALADDRERWIYALRWRLDTLIDKGVLDDVIPDIVSFIFGPAVGAGVGVVLGSDTGSNVLDGIDGGITDSDTAIRQVSAAGISALVDTGRTSTAVIENIGALVLGILDARNRQSTEAVQGVYGESVRSIDALLGRSSDSIDELTGKALGSIEAILEKVFGDQSSVIGRIFDVIDGALEHSGQNSDRVTDAVERALENEIEQSRRNADAVERAITGSIGDLTDFTTDTLGAISAALGSSSNAQADATLHGAAELSTRLGDGFDGLRSVFSRLVGPDGQDGVDASKKQIDDAFKFISKQGNCPQDFQAFVSDFIDAFTKDWSPESAFAQMLAQFNLIQSVFQPALIVIGNCLAQAAARAVPTSLPDSGELREQMRRGLTTKAEAIDDLLSQGYTPERADRLLAARRELPDVLFVQTWYLRGMITADQAFEYLKLRGFDLDDSQAILEMAYTVPPPSDLITMAVREVFSPQVAQRFGQFEDFPKEFADYARMQGISEDWARRYWAAHWGLPSPQQGFEMYQRDVISFSDLQLLLKSLDIMPFWREKLTQIAFRPITRIDIRRMHQLGLLQHDEMVKRYRHMGYSPEDAEFMAQFTERLNDPKGANDIEELEGATKSTVLQLYRRGVITEADARAILKEMGTGERAINVLITNERTKLELETRDRETDLVLEEASAGVISIEEAQDQLGALGLTANEQAAASAKLRKIATRQTKLPTRAEGEKMYAKKILGPLEYAALLKQLGYSTFWTAKFVQLAEAGD